MAESIELQIKSDAQQATRAIGNLQDKLRGLGDTLNSLNGASISNFASGMSQLATSLRSVSSIDTRTFSKIATNMEKLGNLDTARLVSSASALKSMATELSGFANISKQSAEITQLTASISKLGSKSAGYAADNIRNLGSALKEVMTTLSNAPRVSNNIIQMTNALANLSQQGSKVGSASRSLITGFSNTTKSIKSTRSGFRGLASTIGKFYATYWMVMRAVGKIGSAVDLASQLTEVQNVVDTTFGDMASKVDDFTKTSIQDFGMSELTVKQISSRFQALGTSVGITSQQVANGTAVANKALMSQNNTLYKTTDSMADMSLNLTRLAGDMASFYDVDQADVAKSLQSIFSGTIAPLRRYGLDLTQATLSEWAMKNGLDANIKSMTQAEKVLLRYNYVMANTQAAQGDFAKTANTWANSVRVLKQELQAWGSIIGSVIINALKPFVQALSKVMLKVISFTRTVADALGAIFGWTIEISGGGATVDGMEDIADGVGDIGDNADSSNKKAQKLKKTLLSIDEIHALDDNSDSGSGGGSGSGGSGGGGAGGGVDSSLKKTDGLLEKYKSSIKDLYSLGKYIGDALASAMESIDWQKIYRKADNFGKGLADFLNGLISPRLFYDLGATIAGSLNTALHFLNSFGTTFDWTNFGLSIANGINGFFKNFDFALLAKTINAWVQGIYTMLTTAIKNVSWKDVLKGITDFLSNLDIKTVEIIVGTLPIKKIISLKLGSVALAFIGKSLSKAIAQAIASKIGFELVEGAGIGTAIMQAFKTIFASLSTNLGLLIEGLFSGLSLGDAITAAFGTGAVDLLATIGSAFSAIAGTILSIVNFVKMLKDGFSWVNELLMVIGVALATIGAILAGVAALPAVIVGAIVAAVATIVVVVKDNWSAVCELFSTVGDWFNGNVIKPVVSFFKDMWKTISGFFGSLWKDIVTVWQGASKWFSSTVIEPIVGFFKGFATRAQQIFQGIWIIIQAIWIVASGWFNNNVITPISNLFNFLKTFIQTTIQTAKDFVFSTWQGVASWFSGTVIQPISNFFNMLKAGITSALSTAKNFVISTWQSVAGWFNGNVISPITNCFNIMKNGITSAFNYVWSSIKGGVTGAMNYVISKIENGVNFVVSGINSLLRGFNKVVSMAAKVAGANWNGVSLVPKVHIPRLASGGIFPRGEDGMAFINHNELVGKFSNGRNVVANNQQITEGIKQAVMEGMAQVMMNSNAGGNSAPIIENVFKCDSETLYRMTQVGKAKHGQRYIVANEFG
jgi:methyl-accepting chemotaxis protein|uniref:Minor tail protein n=1 Tax=Siphoviridae sp. ct7yc1 TaxID=2827788 RepID=A0A8S5TIG1_9CAUD|nr:MAG TPA: minor tail protein [Siphoviridae sp. ct7yc1]